MNDSSTPSNKSFPLVLIWDKLIGLPHILSFFNLIHISFKSEYPELLFGFLLLLKKIIDPLILE